MVIKVGFKMWNTPFFQISYRKPESLVPTLSPAHFFNRAFWLIKDQFPLFSRGRFFASSNFFFPLQVHINNALHIWLGTSKPLLYTTARQCTIAQQKTTQSWWVQALQIVQFQAEPELPKWAGLALLVSTLSQKDSWTVFNGRHLRHKLGMHSDPGI